MRDQQKHATRDKILQSARQLIEEQGYEAATIRAIAQASGVATGSVFVHFANKEELLYSAFYDDLEAMLADAFANLPPADLAAQLRHLVRHFFSSFAARPQLYQPLLTHSLLSTGEWGERFREQIGRMGQRLVPLYAQAQSAGTLAPDADLRTAITAFFAFYYFLLIDATKQGFGEIDTQLALFDALISQHLAGLCPPRRKTRGPIKAPRYL
ncbi:MAG: TetR/AcrR family transcriptional regulator [Candidatus Sericytochromatia bacterium]